jgi:hypothetical protein
MDNRLIVVDQDPFNPRLQLLILENEQSQVFMLIWISIKQLSRENKTVKTLGFSELMETSYDLYLDYKRNNIEIKHYKRPKSNLMKTSKVAGILLGEHNLDKTLTSMQSKANE